MMIHILKKLFILVLSLISLPFYASESKTKESIENTINFLDNKVLPVLNVGFIAYQLTKNKIPLFKNISQTTNKRINFYAPITLLGLYSIFKLLNQKKLINKKQITERAVEGEENNIIIELINEKNYETKKLNDNTTIVFVEKNCFEADIATKQAKNSQGSIKKKKIERHPNQSEEA